MFYISGCLFTGQAKMVVKLIHTLPFLFNGPIG